jgi:hypothetical protein
MTTQFALRVSFFPTFSLFFLLVCSGQEFKAINNNISDALNSQGKFHELFKLSITTSFRAGSTIGLTHGMWKEGSTFQYSLNTGFMWRLGKNVLGNYSNGFEPNDNRTKSQFVFMFSPILISRLSKQDYIYQEVEPFYFGTPSAVFTKFRHAVTLGTTFTVSPRGYRNVSTIRNRAQQDFVFGISLKNFNLSIYEDFFPFFTDKLQLGDNWDRFFTGGGFVRYRFSNEITMRLYSEVYTGINRANNFLYPDVIAYRKSGKQWKQKNMAYQDPGQEFFNTGWFFARLSYSRSKSIDPAKRYGQPNFDVFMGTAASWTMFSQNFIHDWFKPDKENNLKLHYFLHRTNVPGNLKSGGYNWLSYVLNGNFVGIGTSSNFLKY